MNSKRFSIQSRVTLVLVGAMALAGCANPKLKPAPLTGAEKRAEKRAKVAQVEAVEMVDQVAEETPETTKVAAAAATNETTKK